MVGKEVMHVSEKQAAQRKFFKREMKEWTTLSP